jgi:DNA-directed RNA polymerase subunit M
MEFCPKCGSVLVEKRKNYGCLKCNYVAKGKIKIESTENIQELKRVPLIKEKETNVMPTVAEVCPKCGNKEAYFWTSQTRSADESETKFFKCTKCKHTWRVYR